MGDTGEKTEEATPEKLRKAKEEGQVPKSQDFVGALGFAAGFFALAGLFTYIGTQLKDFVMLCLDAAERAPNLSTISELLREVVPLILKMTLPVLGMVFVMGIFSNVIQTGFFLAFKAIIPKLDKINPVNGFKQMFKIKKLIDLVKNIVKMFIVGWVAYDVMSDALWDMVLITSIPFHLAIKYSGGLLLEFMVKVTAAFIFIGAIDIIIARKQFNKEMMMSKYDVKQEYKQMEGDPHTKGQRKQLAHELLFSGSMENVKNADAVVVNPEHIAVAIKYDKDKSKAPTVVAKGMRVHAEKIKEIAKHYGVPILRNVPLAQALNKVEIGDEIPEELYEAVAEVLAFVYKIKEEQENRHRRPRPEPRGAGAAAAPGIAAPKGPVAPPAKVAGADRLKKG